MQALPAKQPIKWDEETDLDALLKAIEEYTKSRPAGLYIPIPYEPLSESKARIEIMLNRYIDNRIAAALETLKAPHD